VPGELMPRGEPVDGTITPAPGENGTQSFGALSLVQRDSTVTTTFNYRLAPGAVTAGAEARIRIYRLKLQKQPGTDSIAVALSVQLPPGATNVHGSPGGSRDGDTWRLDVRLIQDSQVQLSFQLP